MKIELLFRTVEQTNGVLYYSASIQNWIIHVRKSTAGEMVYQIDDDRDNLYAPYIAVQDLTVLSEEELFQASLVWNYKIPIELARLVQIRGHEWLASYTPTVGHVSKYPQSKTWNETVEY